MNTANNYSTFIASKRLNKTKIKTAQGPVHIDVIWCRTAYNETETWTKKMHKHSFYELHYCLSGSRRFGFDQADTVMLENGHFLIIPPKKPHHFQETSPTFSELVMGFTVSYNKGHPDAPFFEDAFARVQAPACYPATDVMLMCVEQMLRNAFDRQVGLPTAMSAFLQLLMLEMARQIAPQQNNYQYGKDQYKHDLRFEQIENFIRDNVSQKITAEDISRQMNMSIKQLDRIVKKETNRTLCTMINQMKLERIKHLLETTQCTLSDVAELVGYSNSYNMSRFFKREEGMSPGMYRHSLKR
ncbi:MAG: transcriptional regulator, AraC family [Paenibacillus sp.]|nr:transcriptional regulator, AraC family [Paenibacillus sp.]